MGSMYRCGEVTIRTAVMYHYCVLAIKRPLLPRDFSAYSTRLDMLYYIETNMCAYGVRFLGADEGEA